MTALDKSRPVGSGICKIIVLSAYTGGKNVPFDVIVQYPGSKVALVVRVHSFFNVEIPQQQGCANQHKKNTKRL